MLNRLSQYMKILEIAITIVIGNVEDERTFFAASFMKNKPRNRLEGILTHALRCSLKCSIHKRSFCSRKQLVCSVMNVAMWLLISEKAFLFP